MRRRDLLALIGTILWPLAADAQQKAIPLIVMLFPAEPLPGTMDAFLRGLPKPDMSEVANSISLSDRPRTTRRAGRW